MMSYKDFGTGHNGNLNVLYVDVLINLIVSGGLVVRERIPLLLGASK